MPIFLFVKERPTSDERFHLRDVPASMGQLPASIRDARAIPGLLRFLVARFFYSDAVNTIIIVMSVIAVRAMDLTTSQFLYVSVMLTVVAIVASFIWGRLVDRFGPKRTLLWVLASWAIGLILGLVADPGIGGPPEGASAEGYVGIVLFLLAGAIVGSGLGGVQVADRVFMIRLSPPAKLGEFFGLYGLVGKGSQVVGESIYSLLIWLLFDTLGNGAYQIAGPSLDRDHDRRLLAHPACLGSLGRICGDRRRRHQRGHPAGAPGPHVCANGAARLTKATEREEPAPWRAPAPLHASLRATPGAASPMCFQVTMVAMGHRSDPVASNPSPPEDRAIRRPMNDAEDPRRPLEEAPRTVGRDHLDMPRAHVVLVDEGDVLAVRRPLDTDGFDGRDRPRRAALSR